MTGVRVYSLEEALYHCLHNWRQTTEDFLSAPFIRWVEGLGLLHIAAKISELADTKNFSMAFMSFLSLTDFLPQEDLAALHRELSVWERRHPWEKLKEQGDFWLAAENGERAYGFYAKALKHKENVALLNNAALSLMHMGDAALAADYFARALELEPKNLQLHFNHIEASILAGYYNEARELIDEAAKKAVNHPELLYLQGEIQFRQKNYLEAARLYNAALDIKYDPDYLYRLSDCYMRIRQFDKALTAIERVEEGDQDLKFLKKQAEHHATSGNLPRAIKSIEKAVLAENSRADLWTVKAAYHRMDYNLVRAQGSITRALTLAPDNPAALLEQARIRKAQGRTKDYQDILHKILEQFKKDYRKML
jgi:tetratricopeptide (TPR) repeat protein